MRNSGANVTRGVVARVDVERLWEEEIKKGSDLPFRSEGTIKRGEFIYIGSVAEPHFVFFFVCYFGRTKCVLFYCHKCFQGKSEER